MHAFANPTQFLSIARPLTPWLIGLGLALAVGGVLAGLFIAPADDLQGELFRIIYVHVPAAWLGMGAWTGIAISCFAFLVWRHPLAGVAARALAAPGAIFAAMCLITGSIWGRPAWGAWWVWDGRLTSMLVMFFLYLGFIAFAKANEDEAGGAGITRPVAIYGVVGAINLPIVKYSVIWWQSLHQGPSLSLTGGSSIAPEMLWPLLLSSAGFSLLFGGIVLMRMRTMLAKQKAEARMRRMAAQ